jgi:hypothetical protein
LSGCFSVLPPVARRLKCVLQPRRYQHRHTPIDFRLVDRVALEHSQRRRDGDAVSHQRVDRSADVGVARFHAEQGSKDRPLVGALVGTSLWIELAVERDSVLEVVDAERSRFTKSDGAQMPGDGQAAFVGGGDRGLQLRCAKRGIRLERGRATSGVFGDLARDALRVGCRGRGLQIGAGQMNLRSGS